MFDVSFSEILVILIIALLVFGPDRLPEVASKLGKIMGQLRQHSNSLKREFYNTVYQPADEIKREIAMSTRNLRAFKSELQQDFKEVVTLDSAPAAPVKTEPTPELQTDKKPEEDGRNKPS